MPHLPPDIPAKLHGQSAIKVSLYLFLVETLQGQGAGNNIVGWDSLRDFLTDFVGDPSLPTETMSQLTTAIRELKQDGFLTHVDPFGYVFTLEDPSVGVADAWLTYVPTIPIHGFGHTYTLPLYLMAATQDWFAGAAFTSKTLEGIANFVLRRGGSGYLNNQRYYMEMKYAVKEVNAWYNPADLALWQDRDGWTLGKKPLC